MAVVVGSPPALTGDLALFHTTDPLLANAPVLVFHGPAPAIGGASSRIQVHVFTPAGIGSYARLAVSPNSPFYSAVSNLPREEQGDEVCRGLAFGLKRYFAELPEEVKKAWCAQAKSPAAAMLFGDDHVAVLAARMSRIENVDEVIETLTEAFGEQRQSWLDIDVLLPPGSIKDPQKHAESANQDELADFESLQQRYGRYAELVANLGDAEFLPTSKLKRAPSKAHSVGRSASFLRHQKENVRKEICELLTTEESYVDRVTELQRLSTSIGAGLKAESRQQLRTAFPDVLDTIARLNTDFLDSLKKVVEQTEAPAQDDIESTSDNHRSTAEASKDLTSDAQGVKAVAQRLCEWLPRFSEAYASYMKVQAECTQALRSMLRSSDPALAASLHEAGEQKLTSLLIEPVQRLPRYTLYIDSMIKQLPLRHPALKPLLEARDIVTDICAQDDSAGTSAAILAKLRSRVSDWPAECELEGRLVTAVDFARLAPPYALAGCEAEEGILLVFTDGMLLLHKKSSSSVSARGLQSELDSASLNLASAKPRIATQQDLRFARRLAIDSCHITEALGSRVVQVYTRLDLGASAQPPQAPLVDSCEVLRLEGSYEGKAARLVEEIAKAKIERRFGEPERESATWELRASDPAADHASLLGAVFEDSNSKFLTSRQGAASTRILVDIDRHAQRPRAGQNGIRTVVAISPVRDGLWRMTIDSVDGPAHRENLPTESLVPALSKRLGALAAARFAIAEPLMTRCLLSKYAATITSIQLQIKPSEDAEESNPGAAGRTRRPKSPRKLLSTFLSASTGPGSHPSALLKKDLPPLPPPAHVRSRTAEQITTKPPSRESRPPSRDQPTPRSIASGHCVESATTPLKKLEDTLAAYILALQARKGNIVGRSLKMRASADELAVNELYNSLLEDPNMMILAAEASVDVLFAAFEKFLHNAWKEQIGPVIPFSTIQEVQSKAETLFPTDFDDYFRSTFGSMWPQNQRAFKGIMKLLADLLDGTGNDGDRGILTAAFAEVLVTEGNLLDFIPLIDRFVDDTDTYFGEPYEESQRPTDGPGSIHKRARSVNSASISSNTSSLRKKFGFGNLSRANSKSEEESKVASVWRTLSKSTRGEASPAGSISRGTLQRAHSTDIDGRATIRPSSQDGPSLKPSAIHDGPIMGPNGSAHNLGLSTIGEHPSFIPTGPPRKKRRSSLSDLKGLENSPKPTGWLSPSPRRPPLTQRPLDEKSLPNSPMPSTPSSKGGSGRFDTPSKTAPRSKLPSSFRKESSPGADRVFDTSMAPPPLRPRSSSKQPDEVTITARPTSSIPTLAPRQSFSQKTGSPSPRVGLSERAGAGNIVKRPSPWPDKTHKPSFSASTLETAAPTQKLRMQSPQKLRERLQTESTALTATQTSLQDELSKIGDELTSTPSRIGTIRSSKHSSLHNPTRSIGGTNQQQQQPSTLDLAARVLKMESHLVSQIDELKSRIEHISSDLSSSLTVSENKCKKLDELYREANGENEALYARFNEELGKILKAVRGGEGVEEMKRKLRESQEEVGRLKRENGRVKRECVGLRAQLKE